MRIKDKSLQSILSTRIIFVVITVAGVFSNATSALAVRITGASCDIEGTVINSRTLEGIGDARIVVIQGSQTGGGHTGAEDYPDFPKTRPDGTFRIKAYLSPEINHGNFDILIMAAGYQTQYFRSCGTFSPDKAVGNKRYLVKSKNR
jgi:hypothetical protein